MLSVPTAPPTTFPSITSLSVTSNTRITQLSLPQTFLLGGPILSLSSDCRGGVILQKSFYTDFVGPGAAIGGSFDENSTLVYVIGQVQFQLLPTPQERQQAFQQRVACIEQLHYVTSLSSSFQRACRLVSQLCDWVGVHEASEIPFTWVAKLAGVQPKAVALAWQKYWQDCQIYTRSK